MSLSEIYGPGKFGLSFELFPPKSDASEQELFRNLAELIEFEPSFITCTYGAGGSTQAKTLEIVDRVKRQFGCPVASHLTCVGSTCDQLRDYLRSAVERQIDYIVALRGDPPRGQSAFQAVEGGLSFANQLVALVRGEFPDFGVAVAGYPETHQEAANPQADLENLKRKVDSGADVVLTQLFYKNEDFVRFHDRCQQAGITVPIVPGVLPVTNWAQIQRITSLCGACLPDELSSNLQLHSDDADAQFEIGVEFATKQVQGLIDYGVPGVHFYVLNKSPATCRVLQAVARPA